MSAPTYEWQPTSAEIAATAGIAPSEVIRFDHNTSPFRTEWTAPLIASVAAELNEYPGADYRPLREAAAEYTGHDPSSVSVGAGIDELIGMCARAWLRPGSRSVAVAPTYPLYGIVAAERTAEHVTVERRLPDWRLPVDELSAVAATADLVWLCEPNNPTGDRTSDDVIDNILESAAGAVVLDAAYAEFAGDRWASWVERHPNLIVLHTLSKAFGLAAIRVGFAIASPPNAARLESVRPPGSISTASALLAASALADTDRMKRSVTAIETGREELSRKLGDLGLRVVASVTNFVLCEVGGDATRVEQDLRKVGLVVRAYRRGPLVDYLRFTVRTAPEHDRLLDALGRYL